MSEFFLEFFTEEMPSGLQKNLRQNLLSLFKENLEKNDITFKSGTSYSTPNRLVIYFYGIPKKIKQKALKIKGPNLNAPVQALEGFLRSNNLQKKDVTEEENEKGKFYFAYIKPKTVDVFERLSQLIPETILKFSWKKSMKWSNYELSWGRPLKSILALFDSKIIKFKFFHLESNNLTFGNSSTEEPTRVIKSYKNLFETKKN